MLELLWLWLTTLGAVARTRQDLVFENLLLRYQLAVLTRPTRTRPRRQLRTWDKVRWVLARRLCAGWREHLSFVTPDTVVRWHRQGWRLFWHWKSRSRGGRPHLSPDVRQHARDDPRELAAGVRASLDHATALLRAMPGPGWQPTARHARRGEMTVAQIVEQFLVEHAEEQARQLAEVLTTPRDAGRG